MKIRISFNESDLIATLEDNPDRARLRIAATASRPQD